MKSGWNVRIEQQRRFWFSNLCEGKVVAAKTSEARWLTINRRINHSVTFIWTVTLFPVTQFYLYCDANLNRPLGPSRLLVMLSRRDRKSEVETLERIRFSENKIIHSKTYVCMTVFNFLVSILSKDFARRTLSKNEKN
jgi:hypothetical protein